MLIMDICIIYLSRGYLPSNLWILYINSVNTYCLVPAPVRHENQHSTQRISTSNATWIPQEKRHLLCTRHWPIVKINTELSSNKMVGKAALMCVTKSLLKHSQTTTVQHLIAEEKKKCTVHVWNILLREKMRAITAPWKKTMNAQGQVMVSLLSGRLIAVRNPGSVYHAIIMGPRLHKQIWKQHLRIY